MCAARTASGGDARQNLVGRAARRLGREALLAALGHAAFVDRVSKGVARGDAWDELLQLGLRLAWSDGGH